ncbi:MAG: fumarylacetoacetate hydrolase family protein [Rhodospirillaceae bacterium]|nr:fumarylacetoacetate hydrolase family protein [Rhodospirillaceae bacterium]
MKLLRYGPPGQEKPGLLDGSGRIRDLSGQIADLKGSALGPRGLDRLRNLNVESLPVVDGKPRLGPCVGRIGKFLCIGLNYSDHAAETGAPIPKEPIIFMKADTAISGPNDPVVIPKDSKKTDWEVELAIVIGSTAQHVSEERALDYVAGFAVCNDVSEREFQIERSGTWDKGKGCDTFGPLGPWLVTTDEIKDVQNLDMWLEVNGKRVQNGSTKTMIFGVANIVSYCSKFMTLRAGDVISTGTPPGVGMGQKPQPWYLKAGDVMRLGIAGLGEQQQTCVAWRPGA